MKTYTFLLLTLVILLFSCDKEDDPVNPVTNKYLTIKPNIQNRLETKAGGVVNAFKKDDRIGLYIAGKNVQNNVPAEFNGTEWSLKEIEGAQTILAYFPYSAEYETIEAVNVDIKEQTDFLYSGSSQVIGNIAKLNMKHALSLVSIVIMKNDYNYEGKVTELEIDKIPMSGQVNLKSGETKITGEPITYKRTLNYTLDDYNPQKISTIVLPVAVKNLGEVTFRVMIDEVGY